MEFHEAELPSEVILYDAKRPILVNSVMVLRDAIDERMAESKRKIHTARTSRRV